MGSIEKRKMIIRTKVILKEKYIKIVALYNSLHRFQNSNIKFRPLGKANIQNNVRKNTYSSGSNRSLVLNKHISYSNQRPGPNKSPGRTFW